ncbi:MAG: DUF2188 domain-containing protein [Nanoarchaeota archaeon]|nr:DUF2188 domain-containing protein [Nanoarchaeota archaeon]
MNKMEKNKHVVPRDDKWAVKEAGSDKATKLFDERKDAVKYAKELASKHKVCLVVHDNDAKFEEFNCDPVAKNQHVVPKHGVWGVVSAGGDKVDSVFWKKGQAMSHAYKISTKNNVCMIVHGKDGQITSKTCPPNGSPGIFEVLQMTFNT